MRVYVDLVVLLNVLVDFLLLLGTNCLSGFPAGIKRLIPAAVLGGIYAGCCMIPGFHFLGNTLWRLVSLCLMSTVAFGWDASALRRGGIFVLLTMALGGLATRLPGGGLGAVLLAAAGIWALCRLGFGSGTVGTEYVPLEFHHRGRTIRLVALRDTGNSLRDPITGEPVLIVGGKAARDLSGLTEEQLRRPLETMARQAVPGLRLIPYHTVGCGGMLLAMRIKEVKIGQRRCPALIALAPELIGRGTNFQALMGGAV